MRRRFAATKLSQTKMGGLRPPSREWRRTVSDGTEVHRAGSARGLLRHLFVERLRCAPGSEPVAEGEAAERIFLVRRGWLIQYLLLADGRRPVLRILLPGDTFGLHAAQQDRAPYSVAALTEVQLLAAPAAGLAELFEGRPRVAYALFRHVLDSFSAMSMQHVALGRMSARERMAWLLLQLHDRLALVGRAADGAYELPLTQEVLADLLGLSTVHVNRTLKSLRADGLIEQSPGTMRLCARERLAALAQTGERAAG